MLRINDKDYSITFATYFNVEWYEHRLKVAKELEEPFMDEKNDIALAGARSPPG